MIFGRYIDPSVAAQSQPQVVGDKEREEQPRRVRQIPQA
jgi:hypothetical protein